MGGPMREALGHEVIVDDPNYAPMYTQRSRRVKTDRRDAKPLAHACRPGAYHLAHRMSASQRFSPLSPLDVTQPIGYWC